MVIFDFYFIFNYAPSTQNGILLLQQEDRRYGLPALNTLHEADIRTTCFISPVFPGITDVPAIIERVKDQCNLIWLDNTVLACAKKNGLEYVQNDGSMKKPFDSPPVIVNYFYHEEIKKSARKGGDAYA